MDKTLVNPLEQFLLLSKSAKGAAAVELIKQVLETPGIYVFGELLDAPNIKELADSPHGNYYELLTLFAYGTLLDFNNYKEKYPPLTKPQLEKLRHLTIVSLATKSKCLSYSVLLKELDFTNLRELEDLIIEVICMDVIRGKLNQKEQQLLVEYAIGRDVRPEDVKYTIQVLDDWCQGCESVLHTIEMLAKDANHSKDKYSKHMTKIEQEILSIKKSLKTMQQQDIEEQLNMDLSSTTDKTSAKKSKSKQGPRSSQNASASTPKTPIKKMSE